MVFFYCLGPPSFPIVTASDPSEDNKSVNLRCKISSLDYEQRHLYFFKWKFNKNSIQESAKYNMSFNINSPYVCMQSDALMSLRISNFSKQDLGQYKCAVLSLNTTLGEDDINLWDTGKTHLVQCSAVQCSAVQCSAVQCSAVQCSAVHCTAAQHSIA